MGELEFREATLDDASFSADVETEVFPAMRKAVELGHPTSDLLVVLEVRPSRDVDTVVLGRRECPPMGHMRTVRQASASFECRRDSCFGLIGRHADVDVGPATPRLGRAEALERHVRVTSVPIDDVFFRSKAPVPEGCGPKRTYVAACILCHRNAHDLDLGGVRLDPQLPSFCRNLACQLDITMAQSSVLPGGGPNCDSLGSHVHVGEVAHNLRNFGDRGHKPCCFRERSDVEVGVGAREKDPPVLDSDGVVECPSCRSLLAHGAMLGGNREAATNGLPTSTGRPGDFEIAIGKSSCVTCRQSLTVTSICRMSFDTRVTCPNIPSRASASVGPRTPTGALRVALDCDEEPQSERDREHADDERRPHLGPERNEIGALQQGQTHALDHIRRGRDGGEELHPVRQHLDRVIDARDEQHDGLDDVGHLNSLDFSVFTSSDVVYERVS